jgi:membrane peptidoglycan carboxypeptidase
MNSFDFRTRSLSERSSGSKKSSASRRKISRFRWLHHIFSKRPEGRRGWGVLILKIGLGFFLLGLLYTAFLWLTLPDISDPRSMLAAQSTVISDRNGFELYRLFQEEDRTFIPDESIPLHMKQAIISIEDERFYDRGCVDVRAIARIAIANIIDFKSQGGSTITQQLARNALSLTREKRVSRKIKELLLACQLENKYEKDELLNLYLNWIPFGQNAYGIEQASKVYFSSSASGLTLAQSAVLAAIPQRQTYFSPYGSHVHTTVTDDAVQKIMEGRITKSSQLDDDDVRIGLLGNDVGTGSTILYVGGRTDQVLRNMQDQGFITEQERLSALDELENITFHPFRESIRAPYFVLWVREQLEELFSGTEEDGLLEQGGFTVETTLDWDLQQEAEKVVAKHREDIADQFGGQNIALVSMDPNTQEILTYVGNVDYGDDEHGVKIDMARSPRQPGSSFKPFIYASAFQKGYGPANVLYDVPTKIGTDEPQNFDNLFMGPMTIRRALGASRNIPAAKAFFLAGGEDSILNLTAALGASSPRERRKELKEERGEFDYGWPLALGAAETPLLEMVHAYSSFAGAGTYKPFVTILRITDKQGNLLYEAEKETDEEVLDPRIAYQITSILSDESVRPEEYWRTQLTVPGFETAAKTGTSNKCLEWKNDGSCKLRKPDNAWLIGYTPTLVAGVWVGNADSSAMYDKAGGLNTASPIWHDYMVRAHRFFEAPATSFPIPDGMAQLQVSTLSGELPTECTPVEFRQADIFLEENVPTVSDSACTPLTVDKVTHLLASDSCPEEAQEEGSFIVARSILPDRWPFWEDGVQEWVKEQMELWYATDNHSGAILPLPIAPTEECDISLTPGRLDRPELNIIFPSENGLATYPSFRTQLNFEVGSSVHEMRFEIDGKVIKTLTEPPFEAALRIPRSIKEDGLHRLEVILTDEYFNEVRDAVRFRFGKDTNDPNVRFTFPGGGTVFPRGSDLTMRAEASDAEGGVKYVQFFFGDTLLTNKSVAPYRLKYPLDVDPGSYILRAVATDFAGNKAEDSVVVVVE